jgi:hypothetical protein
MTVAWQRYVHYIVSGLEVSLISQQPYKLAHMPCCYYLLRDTKEHGFRMSSNGIRFTKCFDEIGQLFQKLK